MSSAIPNRKYRLHLCIITGQPLANLIPLLQERNETDIIVLMYTDDMASPHQAFVQTLQEAGFGAEQLYSKGGLPAYPFEAIMEYMLELYGELTDKFPDADITWNATGGTKQMALALWDLLDRKKDRVVYTDTRGGRLEQLNPAGGSKPLASLLTPELYLHALGKIKRRADSDRSEWKDRARQRRSATLQLGDKAGDMASLVQGLNRQVSADTSDLTTIQLRPRTHQEKKAVELLVRCGVIDPIDDGRYTIVPADGPRYLAGGWLEEYVWHVACNQQLDFVEIGLKFGDLAYRKKGENNEIDAFIVHSNRLLLVECKTGWMGKDARKDSEIIHKLDSIGTHAGGSLAERLLVSAQPLAHVTRSGRNVNTRERAQATDIHTLEAGDLKTLGRRIQTWKETGLWPHDLT